MSEDSRKKVILGRKNSEKTGVVERCYLSETAVQNSFLLAEPQVSLGIHLFLQQPHVSETSDSSPRSKQGLFLWSRTNDIGLAMISLEFVCILILDSEMGGGDL